MKCTRGLEKIHEAMILTILKKESLYGWEIKKRLEEFYDCRINFGNLYKCLLDLKNKRILKISEEKSIKGPTRKIYKLTPKGYEYCKLWKEELKRQKILIDKILKNFTSL